MVVVAAAVAVAATQGVGRRTETGVAGEVAAVAVDVVAVGML